MPEKSEDVLLSIIIPVYNVAPWLPRCLESVIKQTYSNLDIIIIDDGSTDGSSEIAEKFAKTDSRIRVFHQENKGLVLTREKGIIEAKGSFVGFVDGDDDVTPDMYEKLLKNALTNDAQISQCSIQRCSQNGEKQPERGTGNVKILDQLEGCRALLDGTEMESSLCNKIYRTNLLLNSCLDITVTNNEDLLRNIVLFERAKRSVIEDFCGYRYWSRNGSMSNGGGSIRIGKSSLIARKIIAEHVDDRLKPLAWKCYAQGAINTYNGLMHNDTQEAKMLRQECISVLKEAGQRIDKPLFSTIRIKGWLIIYVPFIYGYLKKVSLLRYKYKGHREIFG